MEIIELLKSFIRPELLAVCLVLYVIAEGIKKSEYFANKHIPIILGIVAIILAVFYVLATTPIATWQEALMAVFVAITQGILCAGASVYVNQLIKQTRSNEKSPIDNLMQQKKQ